MNWISVKDRPIPQDGKDYLVFFHGYFIIAQWKIDRWEIAKKFDSGLFCTQSNLDDALFWCEIETPQFGHNSDKNDEKRPNGEFDRFKLSNLIRGWVDEDESLEECIKRKDETISKFLERDLEQTKLIKVLEDEINRLRSFNSFLRERHEKWTAAYRAMEQDPKNKELIIEITETIKHRSSNEKSNKWEPWDSLNENMIDKPFKQEKEENEWKAWSLLNPGLMQKEVFECKLEGSFLFWRKKQVEDVSKTREVNDLIADAAQYVCSGLEILNDLMKLTVKLEDQLHNT